MSSCEEEKGILYNYRIPPRVLTVNYIFTYDWNNGWPADYPLITEVDASAGYVELTFIGAQPVDLSDWSLVTADGALRLPPGTLLAPNQPLVIAGSATDFRQRFGPTATLLELPGLTLAEQDRLELWHGAELIDRVAWGGALPGWTLSGRRSLCRNPAAQDTNSYLDWILPSPPSPGASGCGR